MPHSIFSEHCWVWFEAAGAKFCENCGQHLDCLELEHVGEQKPASSDVRIPEPLAEKILVRDFMEGVRKQVTVLFADTRRFRLPLEPKAEYFSIS